MVDRVKYVNAKGRVDLADISTWFNLPTVLVGTALYDSTKELASTACDLSQIWGDSVWIGYVPSNPALMTPAAGYVFEWASRQVRTYRMDQERTDVFEAAHSTDEVVSSSDAGGIIINAI